MGVHYREGRASLEEPFVLVSAETSVVLSANVCGDELPSCSVQCVCAGKSCRMGPAWPALVPGSLTKK